MDFRLDNDQELLRATAREIINDLVPPHVVRTALEDKAEETRSDLWNALVEVGWASVLAPAEAGGSGGTLVDACILADVLAQSLAPVPFVASAVAATTLVREYGDRDTLGQIVEGTPVSLLLGRDLSWPDANPCIAWDWLPGTVAIGLEGNQLVPIATAPSFIERGDLLHPLGVIDPVPQTSTWDPDAQRKVLSFSRVGMAASALGLARAALDEAVEYAKERVQYGQPIGNFQAVQHLCADMLVEVQTSESLVYGAAWTVENQWGDDAERMAAAAAAWTLPAAIRTIEDGIQVLGGIGVTWEHDAHLRLRHAHQLAQLVGGTPASLEYLAAGALNSEGITV